MTNLFNWVEIPVTDMARAIAFYERLLDLSLEPVFMGRTVYAVFPSMEFGVHGALVKEEGRAPSSAGPLVYLDANGKMDILERRLPAVGGQVVLGRTVLSEDVGEIIHFVDTEGNRIGLHAPIRRRNSGPVTDEIMRTLLGARKPGFAFAFKRGPRFDDPGLANLQWEHARNMFTLMRDEHVTHLSALPDGQSIIGFGLIEARNRQEAEALLELDPGVAAGRLTYEVMSATSFDGERTRPKL
ncbi:VOC family protein [Ciceribacter sp. L1K22]|uniref:VOC family protein n=1 Tax=Ciceribacter sp. L1K22 TaxID=2820275 RepID=UPI001ABDBA4D|nr:VOC family protein [Ciceribacter sp. L1K22]MBO3759867.1 VOC family protein [Ciceribacter sp. L1K22]